MAVGKAGGGGGDRGDGCSDWFPNAGSSGGDGALANVGELHVTALVRQLQRQGEA